LEISLEKLIEMVAAEVVKELKRLGVRVVHSSGKHISNNHTQDNRTKSEKIDMSKYKTPILTENHINRLHELTGNVIIPQGTIVTPKAKELLKEKNIFLQIKN
jgi:hypothetical protein